MESAGVGSRQKLEISHWHEKFFANLVRKSHYFKALMDKASAKAGFIDSSKGMGPLS